MIPLMKPVIDGEMIGAAKYALENEHLVNGESVNKFEEEFAEYIGKRYAIAVNSGTSALTLGLLSLNLKKDDLVIAPSATFIATANAIVHAGATPLLLDIDMNDYTISVKTIKEAIQIYGKKIKALIPVHLYGHPAKMNDLMNICNDSGITLLEDSCQAHGGEYSGKKLGSFGYLSAFSFYSAKNITVGGDGGMLLTDDEEIADYVRSMRNQGALRGNRYINNIIGYNFRLNNVNCAIGRVQLKKLNSWIMHRRKIAERYAALLKDENQVILPPVDDQIAKSAWHIFAVRIKDRDKAAKFLLEHGVETGIHYPIPIHLQKAYQNGNAVVPFQMTSTEVWSNEILSLPMYSDMNLENIDLVVSYLTKYARGESE